MVEFSWGELNSVDDEDTAGRLHGRHYLLENLDGVFIGPVMENVTKKIDVSRDGLRLEKIHYLEFHPVSEMGWERSATLLDRLRQVFDHE